MKKQITLLLTLFLTLTVNAQVAKSTLNRGLLELSKENAVVTANTNIVLVGEYLYYKLSILSDGKPSQISQIGYVELIGPDNKSVVKHSLAIKNSSANSRLFIPSQLNSGHYKLVAYTNWSKNNIEKENFTQDVFVINPFTTNNTLLDSDSESIVLEKSKTLNKKELSNKNVSIKIKKNSYKNRELVTIDITANNEFQEGNYHLSVRKLDSISINNRSTNFMTSKPKSKIYLPEMRGQLIMGRITNTDSTGNVKNKNVALSITGMHSVFKIANTNLAGQFFFNLNNNFSNEKITLQVIEDDKENYTIELIKDVENNFKELVFKKIKIDKTLKHLLEQRNIKSQIENAYYESKKDSVIKKKKSYPFYKTQEKKYVLNEYTRFPTVRETFIEVLKEAAVRKEGDSYRIFVYDRYDEKKTKTITSIEPLILVDGMVVQKNNDLMNYNPKKIKSISIVEGQYLYGSKLYQGIIDVSTFNQDFKTTVSGNYIMETAVELIEDETIYFQPNYSNTLKDARVPDYRRQLLWLPNIHLKNESSTFSTYTSDDKGTYEIIIEGYSKNGVFTTNTSYFQVN